MAKYSMQTNWACYPLFCLQKELQDEAIMLSSLRHPCCVTFYALCELPPAILTGTQRYQVA